MKKLLGGILLGIGILIAGASGLCSAVLLVTSLTEPPSLEAPLIILIVGGIPFVIGLGLLVLGRALIRSANADDRRGPQP